jgi:ATP-dependent Clp protease ATP-binding subunit ClpC
MIWLNRFTTFNRFTVEARRCVEASIEEARRLGHDSVEDEDLLLGVLAADAGIAAEALDSLGVSLEAARGAAEEVFTDTLASVGISFDEIRQQTGERFEMRNSSPGRLPFSPQAKKALQMSLLEAMHLGDTKITGEHILRGALRNRDGHAVRVMANLGVPVETVQSRLEQLRRQSPTADR